jgi:hypothetical protein
LILVLVKYHGKMSTATLWLRIGTSSGVPRGFGGVQTPPPKFRNFDKVPKIKKILLYEIKFLVPNYSCLQNH